MQRSLKNVVLSTRAVLWVLVCAAGASSRAENLMVYIYEGSTAGSLDTEPFATSRFTITAVADVDQRELTGLGWSVPHVSVTIGIEDLGEFDFITPTRTFVNNVYAIAGFSHADSHAGADLLYAPYHITFAMWDLTTAIESIRNFGQILQWSLFDVVTTGGVLALEDGWTQATFSASFYSNPCLDAEIFCSNREDEDCDGLVDFDDPDCRGCDSDFFCAKVDDCLDDNDCTADSCQNGCCVHEVACNDDGECDDGDFCNGPEICIEGCCVTGEPPCARACCEEEAQCGVCCADVQSFRAICEHGKLRIEVVAGAEFDGESVILLLDGDPIPRQVSRGMAMYRATALNGTHLVCLDQPGCDETYCRKVTCGR